MAATRDQLVVIQAQLEQQLRNIREQRYMEIERVMRTCEGGNPEEGCPAFDCSMCMVEEGECDRYLLFNARIHQASYPIVMCSYRRTRGRGSGGGNLC